MSVRGSADRGVKPWFSVKYLSSSVALGIRAVKGFVPLNSASCCRLRGARGGVASDEDFSNFLILPGQMPSSTAMSSFLFAEPRRIG